MEPLHGTCYWQNLERPSKLWPEANHGHGVVVICNLGKGQEAWTSMVHVETYALSGFAGAWSWERCEGGTREINKASMWQLVNYAENLGNGTNWCISFSL